MMLARVLVIGASGYLGQYLTAELKQRGYWLRVLVRSEKQAEMFRGIADDIFVGQATEPSTLKGLCDGIDWVCSSLGITRQKDGLRYVDVDYQANLNILRLAEAARVTRFLYVSVLNAHAMPDLPIIQAKESFVDALQASSIQAIVIRPSGFFSDMAEFLEMARRGRVFVFADGSIQANPISGRDLAVVCIDSIEQIKAEVNVGGPKVYSQEDVAKLAFDTLGRPAKITYLPLWLARMVKWLIGHLLPEKQRGSIEFFLSVLTQNMVASPYGQDSLEAFYQTQVHHKPFYERGMAVSEKELV